MRVAAFDPGGTTGLAWHDLNHTGPEGLPIPPSTAQMETADHQSMLYKFLCDYKPDVVVCEDFLYRQVTKANLKPVEYIGVIRLWCQCYGGQLHMQTPATGKAFWTDDKLKRVGLYRKGAPHARDATRHLLHYYTFTLGNNYYINLLKPTAEAVQLE